MIDILSIREKVKKEKYRISFTHTEKLREREIEIAEKMLFLQRKGCRAKSGRGFPLG